MAKRETRSQVGLIAPNSRPRIPGPVRGCTAHWNGPAMGLAGRPHSACRQAWRNIQRFHMGRNYTPNPLPSGRHWADVAYTFAVCHHEIAMDGRGKDVRTAANGTNAGNNAWYACFFMVGGNEEPSSAMLKAAAWYARVHLGVTRWNRHTDHKSTTCAGTVNKYISGGSISTSGGSSGGGGSVVSSVTVGDKGAAVRSWQRDLLRWNSKALPRFGADGDFGEETRVWTVRFMRAAGLISSNANPDSPVVGARTYAAMEEALKPSSPEPTPEPESKSPPGPFTDVPGDHRRAEVFAKAKELGLMTGYGDGTMRPSQEATRGDLALVAVRLYDLLSK